MDMSGGLRRPVEQPITPASRGASYAGETTGRRKPPPLLPMCFPIEVSGKQHLALNELTHWFHW